VEVKQLYLIHHVEFVQSNPWTLRLSHHSASMNARVPAEWDQGLDGLFLQVMEVELFKCGI
jgi:hypothetical protein